MIFLGQRLCWSCERHATVVDENVDPPPPLKRATRDRKGGLPRPDGRWVGVGVSAGNRDLGHDVRASPVLDLLMDGLRPRTTGPWPGRVHPQASCTRMGRDPQARRVLLCCRRGFPASSIVSTRRASAVSRASASRRATCWPTP